LPDLIAFARHYGLKIGAVEDLVAYRDRTERYVERLHEHPFGDGVNAELRLVVYRNALDGREHAALVKGTIDRDRPTLTHVHRVDFLADILGRTGADELDAKLALRRLQDHDGPGALVLLRDLDSFIPSAGPNGQARASELHARGIGRQILADLGVGEFVLMHTPPPPSAAERPSLHVVGEQA